MLHFFTNVGNLLLYCVVMNPVTSLDNYKKHCREQHYSHSCRFCDTMTVSYGRLKKHLQTCHPSAMKEEMRNEGDIESDEEKSGLDDCDEPEPLLLSKSCKKKCRRCTKCGFASDDLVSATDFNHCTVLRLLIFL